MERILLLFEKNLGTVNRPMAIVTEIHARQRVLKLVQQTKAILHVSNGLYYQGINDPIAGCLGIEVKEESLWSANTTDETGPPEGLPCQCGQQVYKKEARYEALPLDDMGLSA